MKVKANEHHLVIGELTDQLTGQTLPDTHDERYRQKIIRLLINKKGFNKGDLIGRFSHELKAGDKTAALKIDFLIQVDDKIVSLIKYAPGSLVTRRLSTLALSRTIVPYQIPIVVVTNGEDAEIIDGDTGNVTAQGLNHLPALADIRSQFDLFSFKRVTRSVYEQACRIAFACEVNGACPCDTDICLL